MQTPQFPVHGNCSQYCTQEFAGIINKGYLRYPMFKRCVIFIFLATAYSVLLAHNFTPHQHEKEQAAHHHGHDDDDDDHEDDNNENVFHLLQHTAVTGVEYIAVQSVKTETQKNVDASTFIHLAQHFIKHFEKPPLIVLLIRTEDFSVQHIIPYFFPLKAPPAFTA